MIDHLSIPVADLARSGTFYDAVLATLGMVRRKEPAGAIGYGLPQHRSAAFWLLARHAAGSAAPGRGLHVGFAAERREMVDAFHAAALRHAARDAGPPGIRPQYGASFYGCFVIDPDGFKIEAVCREPC